MYLSKASCYWDVWLQCNASNTDTRYLTWLPYSTRVLPIISAGVFSTHVFICPKVLVSLRLAPHQRGVGWWSELGSSEKRRFAFLVDIAIPAHSLLCSDLAGFSFSSRVFPYASGEPRWSCMQSPERVVARAQGKAGVPSARRLISRNTLCMRQALDSHISKDHHRSAAFRTSKLIVYRG